MTWREKGKGKAIEEMVRSKSSGGQKVHFQ